MPVISDEVRRQVAERYAESVARRKAIIDAAARKFTEDSPELIDDLTDKLVDRYKMTFGASNLLSNLVHILPAQTAYQTGLASSLAENTALLEGFKAEFCRVTDEDPDNVVVEFSSRSLEYENDPCTLYVTVELSIHPS